MLKRLLLTVASVLALAFAPGASLVALADGTPAPSFRPPIGVLRSVTAPTAAVAPTALATSTTAAKREVVIFVGGYQSCSCNDHGFDDYASRLAAAGYDVKHFGEDPRFPYDTYGRIDVSARMLRDEIRALSTEYSAIHIVTHSMGGVVADQAFAEGLSSADGVSTYVSLAAPHSGSDAARAIGLAKTIGDRELLRQVASLTGNETEADAVTDLAHATAVPAPAGIVRFDLRESTDLMVTARDARDPEVASRILNGSGDGHGGILHDGAAIDLTLRTIAHRRVPTDDRSKALIEDAKRTSDEYGLLALVLITAACLVCVAARHSDVLGPGVRMLKKALPQPHRKRCP